MPDFTQTELWLLMMGAIGIGFAVLGMVTGLLENRRFRNWIKRWKR